jgi:hypothetical protein
VLAVSERSLRSEASLAELTYALDLRRPFLAVRIDNVELTAAPEKIRRTHLVGGGLFFRGDNAVQLWNTRTGERVTTLAKWGKQAMSVAFAPTGDTLAVGTEGAVAVWRFD